MTELYLDALESEEEGIVLDAVNSLGDIGSPAAIEHLETAQQRSVECSSCGIERFAKGATTNQCRSRC